MQRTRRHATRREKFSLGLPSANWPWSILKGGDQSGQVMAFDRAEILAIGNGAMAKAIIDIMVIVRNA